MLEYEESLENLYKDAKLDYEYDFYVSYLERFKGQESEADFVKVSDSLQVEFMNLKLAYDISKSVPVLERGEEDKLADSFAFYVSLGVIVLLEDGYYINTKLLAEKTKQFDFVTEKGSSYKKGGIK